MAQKRRPPTGTEDIPTKCSTTFDIVWHAVNATHEVNKNSEVREGHIGDDAGEEARMISGKSGKSSNDVLAFRHHPAS